MNVCYSIADFRMALNSLATGCKIGFVPTMGALHEGHISLVKTALKYTDTVVVSIFVNPTQFNNPTDLERYPRSVEADCKKLEEAGVSLVFVPQVEDIYPKGMNLENKVFDLGSLDKSGEGPRRPGHFNGVAQVVTRLFDIIKPTYAFFGEKDFQQLAIVRYFTKNLGYAVEIIACPIFRGDDGLAMSSRNALLSKEHRRIAPKIHKALEAAREESQKEVMTPAQLTNWVVDKINSEPLLKVEYVEIVNSLTLRVIDNWKEAESVQLCATVYAGEVRLIDNIKLK